MLLLPTPILILFPPDIWYISLLTHFCHPLCYFCCFPLMNMDLSHLGHFQLSKLWIQVSGPEVWNFLGILLPNFLSQILGLPEWLWFPNLLYAVSHSSTLYLYFYHYLGFCLSFAHFTGRAIDLLYIVTFLFSSSFAKSEYFALLEPVLSGKLQKVSSGVYVQRSSP